MRPYDADGVALLQRTARLEAVPAQLLFARGVATKEAAASFFDCRLTNLRDPEELPGAGAAADRIAAALQAGERIVVYGDYDADGMTASAILLRCLRLFGGDARSYVPNRIDEGYGLNDEALEKIAADGAKLVVTVDCGGASVAAAQTAKNLGLSLIITDHHTLGAELPVAEAIVHPGLPGGDYPFDGLCGAGVAFKLAWAICRRMCGNPKVGEREKQFLLQSLALAAIGAVADVVPLLDENRILVAHGLKALCEIPPTGLKHLLRVTNLAEKRTLTAEDVAFTIAPRLNAAGRLGQPSLGVELLASDDNDRTATLAEYLHELNGTRDTLERSIYLAANKQATEEFDPAADAALVLAGRGWHPGVIGIVAGRLSDKFHRSVVVISQDEVGAKPGVGSARAAGGVNLYELLESCAHHLETFGGHAAAAGLTVQDVKLEAFRHEFCSRAAEVVREEDRTAEIWIDAETPLGSLSLSVVEQIEQLAPFGHGNPRPLLCARRVSLTAPPRRMGGGGRHLSMTVQQGGASLRAVAFGGGDWEADLTSADLLSVVFRPVINEFRGRRSVELHIVDWKPAVEAAVAVE